MLTLSLTLTLTNKRRDSSYDMDHSPPSSPPGPPQQHRRGLERRASSDPDDPDPKQQMQHDLGEYTVVELKANPNLHPDLHPTPTRYPTPQLGTPWWSRKPSSTLALTYTLPLPYTPAGYAVVEQKAKFGERGHNLHPNPNPQPQP